MIDFRWVVRYVVSLILGFFVFIVGFVGVKIIIKQVVSKGGGWEMGGGYVEGVDSDFEVRKFLVCFEYFLF